MNIFGVPVSIRGKKIHAAMKPAFGDPFPVLHGTAGIYFDATGSPCRRRGAYGRVTPMFYNR